MPGNRLRDTSYQEPIKAEAETQGFDGRFGAGTPRISDGQLLFLQHMIDGANIDNVGRRDLMLILAAEMSHPDINGLFERKLRNAQLCGLRYQEPIVDDVRSTH